MAEIVLGIGSSHGPQLALPPSEWWRRRDWDMRFPELWYQGRVMRYDELVEERSDEHLEAECTQEKFDARFGVCQRAISTLADTIARTAPDVAVIVGDDQKECFLEDNMPSIGVYWGGSVDTVPLKPDGHGSGEFSLAPPEISRYPQVRTTNPCEPKLGQHIIESLISNGFDPAHSRELPAGRDAEHGIGHAFSYVYRRLMRDNVIPNVPIFLNTYYPPNQPTLKRSFELGRALRRAIESWDSNKRVALIASGGMTHFVIEEDQDREFLAALERNDEKAITRQPLNLYNSGNSEMRNWVVLAGAMEGGNARMNTIDYVPCYRSEAGTGCAMAFAEWKP